MAATVGQATTDGDVDTFVNINITCIARPASNATAVSSSFITVTNGVVSVTATFGRAVISEVSRQAF